VWQNYTRIDAIVPFISPSLSSVIPVLLKLTVLEELNFVLKLLFTGDQIL